MAGAGLFAAGSCAPGTYAALFVPPQLPGKKDLFIEADLMSPLDRIANVSILKQHEVDKLYKVENKPIVSTSDQLCFLVRPRIKNMKYVAADSTVWCRGYWRVCEGGSYCPGLSGSG
uniref:Uncharacterized protein n=1 Tax=Terrapene triunguis TaxID=2587831 RepID=A0A674J533_9SAUR